MAKRTTRNSKAKAKSAMSTNMSLSSNNKVTKKHAELDLLKLDLVDTSDEDSVECVIETTLPDTPSSISKATASTTRSPSSISSISTKVSVSPHDQCTIAL